MTGTALAVHDAGLFELDTSNTTPICTPVVPPCGDANVANDPAKPGDDWADVFANTQSVNAVPNSRAFITDPVSSAENSFYTGGGSKDVNEVQGSWQYATTNDVVPDKDDIAHAFAQAYKTPTNNPNTGKPDTIIYFGMDRYDNSGDSETGFWFFKGKVALGPNGQFVGKHQLGDILVLADWGGSNPVGDITIYQWVGGKNPLALVADNAGADCAKVGSNDNFCAVVNRQNVTPPWTFTDKSGGHVIRPVELFEAGLNLTQQFGEDRCFSTFLAATRSSHSTTAQLKDFAFGGFEQCGAAITITPTATNEVGQTHTFTVHVTKSVAGTQSPVVGVKPTVTLTAANGAVVADKVDNCASTGTNASGDCTVTFTSNSTGTVTGHATATVTIGSDDFTVSTDGTAPNSGDAVKTFVDARISIAPDATNEVGASHTFTVTIKQDIGDGNGLVNVPNGTKPTVTLTDANGATHTGPTGTCGGAGTTSGQCTVIFTSNDAGTVTGHASITLTLAGKSVTRQTDGLVNNSDDAVKTFVDAYITINPPEATNTVGDDHTFTVHVYQDTGDGNGVVDAPDGTIVTVTLTDSDGAQNSVSEDTCADPGTVAGVCTVTFSSPTAGTVTGHASVTLTIGGISVSRETDGTAPNSGDAVKHFVAGSIAWVKHDNAGNLLGGATFTICKTFDYTLPSGPFVDIPDQCSDILDDSSADADKTPGEFSVTGLSLGRYTVVEKTAPAGWALDPDTITVELTPGDSDKTIDIAFVDTREVLKITGFGYTNAATGTPTSGVVSGTTVFTANLHNYGTAPAALTNSSLVVSSANKTTGTLTCNGTGTDGLTLAITGTVAAGGNAGPFSLSCTYTGLNDEARVIADLVVKSTTNTLEREASGSPAQIRFTVQTD